MRKLQICMVASEVAPFAKTGGLADVAAGLTRYLHRAGHDVRVFMPMYRAVRQADWEFDPVPRLQDIPVPFAGSQSFFSVSVARLPQSEAEVYFVRCPQLYDKGAIYSDDAEEPLRFALLSRAAIEVCQRLQWGPHVFHCNDWHTALLPLYLKTAYSWDHLFAGTRTLLTIHNIGYQGVFGIDALERLDLAGEKHLLNPDDVEAGVINFLRTGVERADMVSTVSRTYAEEIQTPEYGMGLEEQLIARRADLRGIVNGVDYGDWNPETDPLIPARYSAADPGGKARCRAALLDKFNLEASDDVPVFGIVSRLTAQKGFELLRDALPVLLERHDLRLIALGTGEARLEAFFQGVRDRHPDRVAFYRGYNNELAHWIEAGADAFLMPSRYEPCGMNQMYSLKYGTVPVVRRTGGLADTVEPFDPEAGTGTGFVFEEFSAGALYGAMVAAIETFGHPEVWAALRRRGMEVDFSWDRQGPEYVALYEEMLARGR